MSAEESNGCCHDEEQMVKLVQDQRPPVTLHYALEAPTSFEAEHPSATHISFRVLTEKVTLATHDPPRVTLQEIYLRNRVFRI
jgi:hypothetical protein